METHRHGLHNNHKHLCSKLPLLSPQPAQVKVPVYTSHNGMKQSQHVSIHSTNNGHRMAVQNHTRHYIQ